nr:protease pro-enzyme activation domain-containing protein [Streptomyces sp. NBC_01764]
MPPARPRPRSNRSVVRRADPLVRDSSPFAITGGRHDNSPFTQALSTDTRDRAATGRRLPHGGRAERAGRLGSAGPSCPAGYRAPWATVASDRGTTAAAGRVSARVYLAGRDPQGLAAYAEAVADPHSGQYGRYLSAQQARSRFGASPKQVAAVTAWLTGAGLTVTGDHQHYLTAAGSVSQAEKAFGTELHDDTRNGAVLRAPSRPATVPASLEGAVLTVVGLDDGPGHAQPMTAPSKATVPPPGAVFRNAGPFSGYYGSTLGADLPAAYGAQQPYAPKGYTGTQPRGAYGATGSDTGQGVAVAVTGAYTSSTMRKDTPEYARRNGDAVYGAGQLVEHQPASSGRFDECKPDKWYSEQALDIEAVHARCGSRSEDRLRGRRLLREQRLAGRAVQHRGQPAGQHRPQLLGRSGGLPHGVPGHSVRSDLPARRCRGHRLLLRLR